eukprot:scaffold31557_cov91-Isochrysis_galbana.AAC.3
MRHRGEQHGAHTKPVLWRWRFAVEWVGWGNCRHPPQQKRNRWPNKKTPRPKKKTRRGLDQKKIAIKKPKPQIPQGPLSHPSRQPASIQRRAFPTRKRGRIPKKKSPSPSHLHPSIQMHAK